MWRQEKARTGLLEADRGDFGENPAAVPDGKDRKKKKRP